MKLSDKNNCNQIHKKMDRIYCPKCGRWLGYVENGKPADAFFPYCRGCKENVQATRRKK